MCYSKSGPGIRSRGLIRISTESTPPLSPEWPQEGLTVAWFRDALRDARNGDASKPSVPRDQAVADFTTQVQEEIKPIMLDFAKKVFVAGVLLSALGTTIVLHWRKRG